MGVDLSDAERGAREEARAFGAERMLRGGAPFQQLGEAGLLGAPLPVEHGGGERGAMISALFQEGFGAGAGDAGLALAWGVHTFLVGVPIAEAGTPAQREGLLPGLASGAIVGASTGESDARATPRGDGWTLDGAWGAVPNAPDAGVLLVCAVTSPDAARAAPAHERAGRSVFLVRRGARGLSASDAVETSGLRGARFGDVALDGCEVDRDDLLGEEGGGERVIAIARRWQRACALACWIGLMQAGLDGAAAVAPARSQAARARLADMRIRLEAARALTYRAARAIDRGDARADHHGALAALHLLTAAPESARDALDFQGAAALLPDHPAARAHRDAALIGVVGESAARLRSIVAASILTDDGRRPWTSC